MSRRIGEILDSLLTPRVELWASIFTICCSLLAIAISVTSMVIDYRILHQ